MDLPTCPACGQSVLDDDATDCPFCGASMRGPRKATAPTRVGAAPAPAKPAAKPSAPGPTNPQPAKSEPTKPAAAATKPASPKPAAPSAADDDDPFAIPAPSTRKVIKLAPQPVQGRSHKIVCPMCETAGYASRQAAGREVYCTNPKCLVPIFKAPEIKPEPEPEPEKPRVSMGVFLGGTLLLLAAAGGAAWYFFLREGPKPIVQPITEAPTVQEDPEPEAQTPTEDPAPVEPVVVLSAEEMRQQALPILEEASRESGRNRSKPFCRRMTAEAYASVADLDGAREQLSQLRVVGERVPYYQIVPLTMIAWKQLEAGDQAGAKATVEDAFALSQRLPQFGSGSMDSATALATALVAVDRDDDARALLATHFEPGAAAQLAAELRIVKEEQTFDLATQLEHEPLQFWSAPLHVAVTLGLLAHDRADAAQRWATAAPTVQGKAECLAALAARPGGLPDDPMPVLQQAFGNAGPAGIAGTAFVLARLATRHAEASQQDLAAPWLQEARSRIESIPVPEEIRPATLADTYRLNLADPAPLQLAALAAAQCAQAEGQNAEASWALLQRALGYYRASAPSPVLMAERVRETEQLGVEGLAAELQTALRLRNLDEARIAAREYRTKLQRFLDAANTRFALESHLLSTAGEGAYRQEFWDEMVQRASAAEPGASEPWMSSSAAATQFVAARQSGDAAKVDAMLPKLEQPAKAEAEARLAVAGMLKANKLAEAARQIEQTIPDPGLRSRRILSLATSYVPAGTERAMQFVSGVQDPLIREEAYELVGALAGRLRKAEPAWDVFKDNLDSRLLAQTEQVALGRGLVEGLTISAP